MSKLFSIAGGVVIVGILVFLIVSSRRQDHSSMNMAAGMRAPEFALQNYEGQSITRASFVGKLMVINSWAAWCPFCKKELVDFAAVQKEFGDAVVIIAIDRAESKETAKQYSDELGVTDDLIFLLDPSDSFYQSIGGFSMPETIFVDTSGEIVIHKRGPMDIQEIREKIQQLISL